MLLVTTPPVWAGEVSDVKKTKELIEKKFPYRPVFLSEKEMDLFYHGNFSAGCVLAECPVCNRRVKDPYAEE